VILKNLNLLKKKNLVKVSVEANKNIITQARTTRVKFSNKYTNIFITGLEHNVNNKKLF
jgi:hypothetical protein